MNPTFKEMSGGLTVYFTLIAILSGFLAYGVATKPSTASEPMIQAQLQQQ